MKQRLLFVVIVSFLMLVGFAQQGNFGPQGQKTSARSTSVVPASDSANFPVSGTVTVTPPTGASSTQVQGTAANGAATVGNPVLVCGINGGNCVAMLVDSSGRMLVAQPTGTNLHTVIDSGTVTTSATATTPADATSNTSIPGPQSYTMVFNGSTWDRLKGITGQTGLIAVGTVNSGSNPGDATSQMFTQLNNAGNSQLTATGVGYVFNNSTYDRLRSGNSANLPNLIGSQLVANVTVDPCQSSAVAKSSVAINISSATTTQLVDVSGSTVIYVCGFTTTMVGATESIKFVYGTKVTNPCDTGQTALTGAMADGTVSDIAWSFGPGSTIFKTAAAQQLCAVTTGTVSIQGVLTYVQQ